MIIIGLDISTTTIGIAVLKYKNKKTTLIHKDYYKPPKDGTMCERLFTVKEYFNKLFTKYKPDRLAVEDYIQFMKGGSGAKTIIPLALFNRTICLTYYEKYKKNPYIYNVLTIRHAIKTTKVLPKKEDIPELVYGILGIENEYMTRISRGKEVILPENYDIADAIAVALCHISIEGK